MSASESLLFHSWDPPSVDLPQASWWLTVHARLRPPGQGRLPGLPTQQGSSGPLQEVGCQKHNSWHCQGDPRPQLSTLQVPSAPQGSRQACPRMYCIALAKGPAEFHAAWHRSSGVPGERAASTTATSGTLGILTCEPGDGEQRYSWQPRPPSASALP